MNEGEPKRYGITKRELLAGLVSVGVNTFIDCLDNEVWAHVYREGQKIRKREAVIGIFPEKLQFESGRKTLVVSRSYQTAAVYDEKGNLMKLKKGDKHIPLLINAESFIFQAGTGAYDTPTPLGIGEIITHMDEEYVAQHGESKGASMSSAMHVDQFMFNEKGEKVYLEPYRGIAVHGRHTTTGDHLLAHMSHACVGVEKGMAKFLQTILKKREGGRHEVDKKDGDYVLVVEDEIPKVSTLVEAVKILRELGSDGKILDKGSLGVDGKRIWKPYEGDNMKIPSQPVETNAPETVKKGSIWEKYIKKSE